MSRLALPGFFYPVARSSGLRDGPLERTIDQHRVALFRDATGRARALDARCPHRGANLADGVVRDGCLACPYHGWRFAGDGRCALVPSHPDQPIPARAAARAHEVVEQQGLLWVRLADASLPPPQAAPPRFPVADDPAYRAFSLEGLYPGPADWWLENFMDISHVPFVHQRTFGARRAEVRPAPVERRPDGLGFEATVQVRYEYGLGARLLHGSLRTYEETVRFHATLPASIYLMNDMGNGKRQAIAFLATPVDAERTWVIMVVWRNYLRWLPGADGIGRRFTRSVLLEDQRIVTRSVAAMPAPERAAMAADGPVQELLRLFRRWRGEQPVHG